MRRVLFVAVAALVAGCGASSAPTATSFPKVTLGGVGGVLPGTPLRVVRKKWEVRLPTAVQQPGGEAYGYAPVCIGAVRGIVGFTGANLSGDVTRNLTFNWAVFTAGVQTDTGIRIGSSAADVRRIYGRKLRGDVAHHELRIISARAPRTTIIFELDGNRVTEIGFGARGEVDMDTWRASC